MDENGQGDLTPAQRQELGDWLAQFLMALESSKQAKAEFMAHPGRFMRKYLNARRRLEREQAKER